MQVSQNTQCGTFSSLQGFLVCVCKKHRQKVRPEWLSCQYFEKVTGNNRGVHVENKIQKLTM